ncbi:hypothetical protein GCM10008967_23070 [Bacillus carboniphilus]|uniref:Flagellar hook-length control protein-like C-terminal domain-containing protein n=1 Tax=Bacillus carboniphilus TaxID=86663 RepID=A0ABN0WBH8_9BACI
MNVASVQATGTMNISKNSSSVENPKGFASLMANLSSSGPKEEKAQESPEGIQALIDFLSQTDVDSNISLPSTGQPLEGLDSFLLTNEEDLPFELLSLLQVVTGMNMNDLLEFLNSQPGNMANGNLFTFENWSEMALSIENGLSKGETPSQSIVKMLELLKTVELVGNKLSLTSDELKAFQQLKDALFNIREQLILLNAKRDQTLSRAYESFHSLVLAGKGMDDKQPSKLGVLEGSTKMFEGNISFMSNIKQPIVSNSEAQSRPLNFQQFTEMLSKMMQKSQFTDANGVQKLFVKLHPEHLGTLRIEIMKQDGVLTARLLTSTPAAKEMIEAQLQGLRNALATQQVEKIEVANMLSNQQERSFLNKEQQEQQSSYQQQPNQDKEANEEEKVNFEDILFELIV